MLCVIKDIVPTIWSSTTLKDILYHMIIQLAKFVTTFIKMFWPSAVISNNFIPKTIITSTTLDFQKYCIINVGTHFQTHKNNIATKTVYDCSKEVILLGPHTNQQSWTLFLSLKNVWLITSYIITKISMYNDVCKNAK